MDWSTYWTWYLQLFLAFPLIWFLTYIVGAALLAPVVSRMHMVFKNYLAAYRGEQAKKVL